MPYDSLTDRDDATALMPEDASREILKKTVEQSAALSLFRHVQMSRSQRRLPVLSVLPFAYFVNGDTGYKQTTEVNWDNKFLNAEEIAVIMPVPENVIDDSEFDVWAESEPFVAEAIGRALDAAVFFGTNKPASWPDDIETAATAASNVVARGANAAAAGGIAADISDVFSEVENDGFDVNGAIARRTYRGLLRNARNADGDRHPEVSPSEAYGVDIEYPLRGLWPTGGSATEFVAGDFMEGILGVRQDISFKVLDQAVIQDPSTGDIVLNLAQQDAVAVRVVARFAFQVANVVNHDEPTEADRYPFALLQSPAS